MPFDLHRDDERRLLIVRAIGTLSPSEIAHFIRTQRMGALARYRLLFDATNATIRARPSDLDLWVDTVRDVVRREGLRPPVALVASTDALYSFFETYARRCRDELDVPVIRVFRRFEPARAWLDQV